MSAHSSSTPRASRQDGGAAATPAAVLVAQGHDGESTYALFEMRELSPTGAFLAGALLLEMNEDLELDLTLGDGAPVRVRARVVRLERGDVPGMEVAFSELGDEVRKRLEGLAATVEP